MRIYVLTCIWIFLVLVIVLLQGFDVSWFKLSPTTLHILIGSTTVNVVGLFLVVANYLFPKRSLGTWRSDGDS